MGITLRQLIFDNAGGMKESYEFKGALLGGAAGTFVDSSMLDVPLAYETLKEKGATLGSGAVIVIDNKTNLKELLVSILDFFKHESCGKCVPCRIGTKLLLERITAPGFNADDFDWLLEQSTYMVKNSLCPLGQSTDLPLKSFVRYFKNDI
jgi:NADH:ubiquinone oxidoreductase subunit F (NADH-binding)